MHTTIATSAAATPREGLAPARPQVTHVNRPAQASASRLRELAAEAIRRVTSQKAAAISIGIHEGRLSHKVKDGSLTLAQLESLDDPKFCAEFGKLLLEEFGALDDPKVRARRTIREAIDKLKEIEAFLDFVS